MNRIIAFSVLLQRLLTQSHVKMHLNRRMSPLVPIVVSLLREGYPVTLQPWHKMKKTMSPKSMKGFPSTSFSLLLIALTWLWWSLVLSSPWLMGLRSLSWPLFLGSSSTPLAPPIHPTLCMRFLRYIYKIKPTLLAWRFYSIWWIHVVSIYSLACHVHLVCVYIYICTIPLTQDYVCKITYMSCTVIFQVALLFIYVAVGSGIASFLRKIYGTLYFLFSGCKFVS